MFLNCENIKEYSNKVHEINTDVKKFEDHICYNCINWHINSDQSFKNLSNTIFWRKTGVGKYHKFLSYKIE